MKNNGTMKAQGKLILSYDIGGTFLKFGLIKDKRILLSGKIRIYSEINSFEIVLVMSFILNLCEKFINGMETKDAGNISFDYEAEKQSFKDIGSYREHKKHFLAGKDYPVFTVMEKQSPGIDFDSLVNLVFNKTVERNESFFYFENGFREEFADRGGRKMEISGIALCSPGFCDPEKLMVIGGSPNLKNIAHQGFKELFSLPVTLINDINAQGFYLLDLEEFSNVRNGILVALGTGIGGALIIDGKVYLGQDGGAGEIGHISLDPHSGKVCNCGKIGCAEALGSVRALIESFNGQYKTGEEIIRKSMNNTLTKPEKSKVEQWINYLGILCGNLINIFNPRAIILSGALIAEFPELIDLIQIKSSQYCFIELFKNIEFKTFTDGQHAGIIGAYLFHCQSLS